MSDTAVPDLDPDQAPGPPSLPPATGDSAVDEALSALVDLDSSPVGSHHDTLARAHEALQAALDKSSGVQDPSDLH